MALVCDAVFEGGGVRGIGLVGGVRGIEDAGYSFGNVAGTSAGAIVASLLGAGYTGSEIREEMLKLDFNKFQGEDWLTKLGLPGKAIKLFLTNGVFNADYLEDWLDGLLKRKGKTRFGDIRVSEPNVGKTKYRFQAVASDLSESRMLALPRDLVSFGIEPDHFSITKAVRMSMSIPIFYEPYILTDVDGRKHVIADGGLLSNYPMWLLDNRKPNPPRPTFGFKFCSSTSEEPDGEDFQQVCQLPDFLKALVRTTLDAHDKHYISVSKGDYQRTISISPVISLNGKRASVNSVDFAIKADEQDALYNNGLRAAKTFLRNWNFENWKAAYRSEARRTGETSRSR
ncbi:MAG: patatin-like phospholipase family protein [Clostridiales bacterium]|jgi:NTE family protein|nr:patatin-like phospholipase family protein [Clostridiales bacterium]